MKIFPSSLLYKALLAIVLVLIPIFITFLHGYNRNREFLKENILSDITVIAEAYEGQVYQFLEMAKRRAMDFSSDGSIKEATQDIGENGNYSAEKLSKHLRDNKLSLDKTLRRVLVASIDGKVLASTDTALIGKDISTERFFINGKNSPNVTENSATDSLTPEIAVSSPIYGHTGEVTGVVANFIDLSELNYLLSGHFNKDLGAISWSKGKKETMEVYLVRNGFMITDSIFINDAVLKQAADTLPVRRCLESSTETTGFYDDYRGIEVAGASMCIPSMGWTLLAEIDSSEVLAPIADIRKDAIIAGSVLAGLLGILFTVFFKNVIMRLRALSNASAEMGKGNYDINLPVGSADEIGALSDVFNRMAGEIKDRTKLLADNEARLSAIIENSTTFIYLKDPDGKYLHANSAFNKLVRKPREEIIGKTDFDLFPAATAARFRKNDESVLEANKPMEFEEAAGSGNGERFYLSVKVPIADPSGKTFALCGISTDITERKIAEEKIERLNRLYSVLSKTNEAIVRIRDTGKLYEEACRIAVEDGGFLMAWIGLAGPDMEIKPAAFVGANPEYLNGIRISALDIPEGRGPTGSAVREGTHKVCNRIESDRRMDLWRDRAKNFGYKSSAAFPVRVGGRPAGSINLYSGEEDFFTEEEVMLLDSMAADISFAVDSIEMEKQAKRADDELHLLQDISLEIKEAEDFQSALKVAITKICAATGWDAGEVWIPAKDGFLEHIASSCALCTEEKPGLQEFLETRKALRFKPDKGIPGMVWSTRKSLWISDVEKQEFVVWRGLIARAGFKSAFGTPIFSGDKVLAVLAFFMKEAKEEEDKRFTDIVSAVSAQLGSVIQRKLSEEARLELQKRYEALLNNLTIGIYRNTEGDEGHFIEVNRAFVSMFDADSKEDLLKHRIGDFLFDKGKSDELESRLLGSGYINDEEVELITLKGRRLWASMTAIMKKDDEGKIFFDGFVEDITEKKKLEEQLRYSQKMEAVGQLAGGIAHDFNNILTALIGYGNLLLMKRSGDDTVTGFASQMITLSEKAAQLTHGLLAFGRKQVMNVQPTDLNELVTRVRKILQRLIGENIEIKASLPENPVIAKADSTQIEQVLVNLATNSRDAMPKGGTILISTGIAKINEAFIEERGYGAPGMYAKLSFSDNGAGIDSETQKRIFEPFFTTKEVGQGTGLGLSVVYGIIKQHNGFIEVRSEKGAGTEFNIYLPLAEVTIGKGARLDGIEALMGENESVLLAEDEPEVRKITRTMLEEFGYSVIEAENGEDAVAKYMEHMDSISLLIMDMVMPKKSGREAYEEIRKISPSIKVLFTSGYTRNAIDEKEIGGDLDFISKPASPGDLLKKVKEVLRR